MEKQKNIPQLRFPEFQREWGRNELSEIACKQNNKNNHGMIKDVFTNSATQGVINQRDYFDRDIANKQNLDGYYIIEYDEFVYNPRISVSAPVGPISRNLIGTGIMSPLYTVFRFKSGNLDFFEQYFKSTKWYNYLKSVANYGARFDRMNLTNSDFFSLPIFLPSNQEQQKIASFFTTIDQKISYLKRKKILLEQYKKGVMQKIFSQEIRFKDDNGQEFPKWGKKRLGDISDRMTTKNTEGNENVLTISAQHGLVGQLDFFNKSVAATDLSGYYLLKKDDFAYNKSYSAGYPMGAFKRLKLYNKGVVSTLYICFSFKTDVSLSYMEQYFESGKHNREIEKVAQEGARNHGLLNIGVGDFFNSEILIPSLPEQTKIANFLSAIDDKINHTQNQIEKTEVWKKGLMQQMFV